MGVGWEGAGGVAQGIGPEFKPQYCKKYIYVYIISISASIIFPCSNLNPLSLS
jgi:hypothetical protein